MFGQYMYKVNGSSPLHVIVLNAFAFSLNNFLDFKGINNTHSNLSRPPIILQVDFKCLNHYAQEDGITTPFKRTTHKLPQYIYIYTPSRKSIEVLNVYCNGHISLAWLSPREHGHLLKSYSFPPFGTHNKGYNKYISNKSTRMYMFK